MQPTASSLVKGITNFEDHQRWFEFHQSYQPMIRNILLKKGLLASELEDVEQEVFMALLSTIGRFAYDRQKGQFRSWLSKVTDLTLLAYRRRRSNKAMDLQEPAEVLEDQANAWPSWEDERMQLCLQMVRSRLDMRSWQSFYLHVVEQCSIEETQRLTGLSRNTVYQAVHRVKACLREMLAHLDQAAVDQ